MAVSANASAEMSKSASSGQRSAYTIGDYIPLAGTKRVCYTKDVDLNSPEYKDTCTSGHPCESDCEGFFLSVAADGHIWHGMKCESCDVCDNIFDLTVDWEYEVTCEPGTSSR